MASASLKELFTPSIASEDFEETEESIIGLSFKYGDKHYCTSITNVKEIIDFPHIIPLPVASDKTLGVFNLRGNIIPVLDPEEHLIKIQKLHRHKASAVFSRMKLRLIVFEVAPDAAVAFPVYEVGKCEVTQEEATSEQGFIRINGIPHEKFDINVFVGGNL
ncbi:MAG TPA: chemotaxis protein CheW [Bacteriovoracaceae bacterium]|nr:chemotaxis protein CheW [Bacteriovoracaceae bacterium]